MKCVTFSVARARAGTAARRAARGGIHRLIIGILEEMESTLEVGAHCGRARGFAPGAVGVVRCAVLRRHFFSSSVSFCALLHLFDLFVFGTREFGMGLASRAGVKVMGAG